MEERRQTYYQNKSSLEGYSPLNTITDFQETVKEIQKEADERLNRLKE